MAKGLTTTPLVIVVAEQWFQHPPVLELMRQGHRVVKYGVGFRYLEEPDLILHPAAHGWNDHMWDYLPAAITAARRRRKEKR